MLVVVCDADLGALDGRSTEYGVVHRRGQWRDRRLDGVVHRTVDEDGTGQSRKESGASCAVMLAALVAAPSAMTNSARDCLRHPGGRHATHYAIVRVRVHRVREEAVLPCQRHVRRRPLPWIDTARCDWRTLAPRAPADPPRRRAPPPRQHQVRCRSPSRIGRRDAYHAPPV